MSDGYVHVDLFVEQAPKHADDPCGDVYWSERTPAGTTLIVADGIGSGVRAHIAAEMAVAKLKGLLNLQHSLHQSVAAVAQEMERRRSPDKPFAAFTAAVIRADGLTTILGYEAPGPILISRGVAAELTSHPVELGGALCCEYHCYLEAGDGLLVVSDGISQAGLGSGLPLGWEMKGVARFLTDELSRRAPVAALAEAVQHEALQLWKKGGDDCTTALAAIRKGRTVNLLTGPPAGKQYDAEVVNRFKHSPGAKVVCGGSTAELVARASGAKLELEQQLTSAFTPPRFRIAGIDLVTEGAVTLNQVFNLLGEDPDLVEDESGTVDLLRMLTTADRINIFLGLAQNRAHGDLSFRLRGVLPRDKIMPLLIEKLKSMGKLVVTSAR